MAPLVLFLCAAVSLAQQSAPPKEEAAVPFKGEINTDTINVRTDSTVGAPVICTLNRQDPVEVIGELYEWYKIKLPKSAPSYIKKTLVSPIDDKTVKVLKDRVNIRLTPSEQSPILGKAHKDEVLRIAGSEGEWFKIEPSKNSHGWINKKFVHPFRTAIVPPLKETQPADTMPEEPMREITLDGTIQPYGKIVKRIATHKLIVREEGGEKTYLLRGSRKNLNALNYHTVTVTGRITGEVEQKYPVVEIIKIELRE